MPDGDFSFADAVGRPAALPPATLDTPAPQTFSFEEAIGKPPPATVDSNVPANPWVEAMWKDAPDSGELGPPSGAKEPPLPTGYTGDGRPYQSGWKWGLFNQDQPMDFVPDGTIKVPGQTRVQAAGNAAGAQLLQGFGQVAAAVPRLASNMQDPFKFHDLSPEDREKAEAWYNQRRQESTALANSIASAVADSNARNAPVDPKYTNDIAVNLAGGAGGLAPMVLGTMLGGVGGGAFVAGVQGYESTSENALAHGATPHDAHTAGMVGGLVSAGLMTVPAAQWLGGLTPAIRQPLVNAIVGTAVHSGSMVSIMQTQTLADNLIARNTYDPTRPITLGLGEHITDQALLGAFLPLATHSVPHLASHLFEPLPPTASERVQQNVLRTQEAAEPAFDAVDQQPNAQVPPTVTGPLADAITAQMRYAGLPPDVGVRLMNQVAGGGADGIYARGLVTMAMDTPPDQVPFKVQHETMHALLDPELGLLNDQDRQTLYRAANRWLDVTAPGENLPRRRLLAEQYGVHPLDPVVQEEGVARLSEAALLNGITTRSPIGAAAAKINNFVTSLGQGLRGQGFRTADDVFNGLMSGERAEPMTAGTAQYALPPRTRDTRPAPPAAPPPEPPPAAPPSEPPLATTEFTPLAEDPAALERELISGLPPIRPEMATTPEPQSDVEAQIAALRDPNNPKDTVFLAAGTPVPKAANAPGVLAYQRPEGTLLTTDVRKAREFADAHAVDDAFMARLLGYPETKSDVVAGGAPHVVQGRDEAGNVVVETLASPAGLPAAEAMVHEQAPVVEVTTPAAAQAERAEKTAAEAPVATPRPITADEMGARAAGVRAAPEPAAAPPSRAPRVVEPYVPVPKEPMRLINFLRTPTVLNKGTIHETTIPGGLQDTGNDIRSIIGGVRGRPGLLNAKGRTLDDATMHAWEAGYFPEHDQRPTINHLLDKIREDHTGNPQYSIHDQEAVEAYRDAMARNNEIGRLAAEHGIPTQGLTNAEFFDRLADRLSQDEMADEQARLADEHEAAYSEAERATQEWVAYHGTPHDFEQFDVGKIGTGEGAQAYGHGLYFAEAPGIAAGYRNKLTLRRPDFQKKAAELADVMRKANDAERQALDLPHDSPGFLAATRAAKEARDAYKAFAVSPGNLLTVRLRAKPEEMLDWDRPFSEQSPKVQDALSSLGLEPKADAYLDDESAYAGLGFPPRPKLSEEIPDSTGKEIYHAAEGKIGAPAEVSRMLHEAGIKGIRYLDASSRGAGDGTRNVVVFDHNDIEITHRNGIAVTPKNWNPDQFYGNDQARSLENLEHEHRQEEAALAAQQRAGGTEPPGPAGPHQGVVEEGARPVGGAAGVARRGEAEESTPAAESPPRGIEALPNLPIVKHMTKRGKVIEGVIRSDIDHAQAKALDPYTFKKNGGWFVRRDAAEAEAQGIPPPTVEAAASPRTAVQDVADAARRDLAQKQAQVTKLRSQAKTLADSAAADLGRDRQANTARRASMAASAVADASSRARLAETMNNIATAIENGEAPRLSGVTSKAQVEALEQALRNGQYRTAQKTPGAQWEKERGRPPTPADVANARMPDGSFHRTHAPDLAKELEGKRGFAPLVRWLKSAGDHENNVVPTTEQRAALEKAIKAVPASYAGKRIKEALADRERFVRMGINGDDDLHKALLEYIDVRGGTRAEDPIKRLERNLVGNKSVGVDFFPTPPELVENLVREADIKPGMRVLEPSAGKGDIADAMKGAGGQVDTIEISPTLREILEAKGYKPLGQDFMEYQPDQGYDRIVMNPPFSNGMDAEHVQHAYDMLNPGGRMVAIMGEGSFFRSDKRATGFRDWLSSVGGESQKLPDGSFKSAFRPTGVATRMVVIDKPAEATRADRAPRTDSRGQAVGSWFVVDKATGKPVLETFEARTADAVNRNKYDVVPAIDWLASLNRKAGVDVGESTSAPDRGLIEPGDRLRSRSGRELSPVPKFSPAQSDRTATNAIRKIDTWLLDEARKEAVATKNDHLTTLLKGLDTKNFTPSDRDTVNEVLFGRTEGPGAANRIPAQQDIEGKTPAAAEAMERANPAESPKPQPAALTPDQRLAEADAAHRDNFPAWQKARDEYHAGRMSDTDFLAAQAHHKSLVDAWDEADRAVRAAPKAKNTDLLGRPITETTKRGPEPTIRTDPNQAVMPGMEPSAVQAQAAADQKGRGAIGPTGEVKPANEGLFAPDTSGQGELQAPQAAASEAARPAAAPPVEHPGLVIHTRKPEWQPASAPSLSRPAAILAELNARNAPDIDYRAAFSTGAKTPLKPGETWKGRLEAWVASEASGKPGAERPETEQPKAEQAAPPPDEKPAGYGANNKTFTADVAAAARERLRAKLNRLNAGFDPEIMLDGLTLAGFHIEAGARSFADYTKAMLADLGDHVRPFLGHFYNSVRDYPGFDNHGMDNREAVERELQRPTRAEPPQRGDENDPLLANNIERWLQEGQPPDKLMANAVAAMLAEGDLRGAGKDRSLPVRRLQQSAEMIYGGKLGEGKFPRDRFYDAIEAGVNRYIANNPDRFSPTGTLARAQAVAESLREIKDRLPTQTVRAGDKDKLQQFSTPPDYSFAAAWIANMRPSDRVLEPSAGNGGLAVHAMNAGAAEVIGNEISPQRRAMMQNLPFSRITGENAEQLHNILPVDVRPSVVIMNPPFSSAGDRLGGKMDVKIGAQHIDQALARLEPGGRLVAIVGRGMGMNAPTFRDWWKRIGTQYDVRANVAVDGSIYRKYGTTFGTRVLVIDKIAPTGRPIVEGEAKDAADLLNTLAGVHDDRPGSSSEPVGGQPTGAGLAEEGPGRPNGPEGGLPNPTGAVGPDGGRGVGEVTGRPVAADESGPGSAGRAPDTGNRAGEGGGGDGVPPVEPRHEPAGEPVAADANDTGRREPGGGIAAGGGDHLRPDGSDQRLTPPNPELVKSGVIVEDPVQGGELTESVYEPYRPQRLAIEGAREHPGALVQSTAMASVSPPMPRHALAIPRRLIDGGALSIAQLEAVVYAGDAHAQILPAAPEATVKYRRGFFVGDGTGVGKGREVAGIILDNWMSGRRRAVWVSETPALVNDAKRDWAGLGMDPSHILPLTKVKAADAIKHDGILFASYDTLKSGVKIKPLDAAGIKVGTQVSVPARDGTRENGTVTGRYKDGWVVQTDAGVVRNYDAKDLAARTATAKTRVQQIVDWLGKDFDGVIAFDESHNLGNSISQKGARGSTDPAQKALAGIELQKQLPNARVVYVSATGATEVSNLAYADRLGLWGRGTAFSDRSDFLSKISQGGVAAMELVARDMKALGHYMARNLSYDGVEYDRIQHDLTPDQTVMYDKISEAWQVVLRNFNKALEDTNAGGKGGRRSAILSAFWGAHQRFFNQLITSLQMPSVLRAVERDVAEGRQAVLQLVNTNEAGQNRAIDKARADPEGDIEELDMSPRDQLMALVEKAFPVEQFETYVDDAGKERVRPVVDSEGKPVLNREAVAAREKLLDDLGSLRVPDGPLEILTSHFGPDKVAEVTGRTQRVVRKPDESGQVRAVIEKRNAETNVVEANAFQNGVKRILVFSQAGGTGRSYHADLSSPSADNRRSHYLVQPGWRADKAVQGFGRTHRTNQASAPIFHLVTTNLEGQKRFISSIARRLGQLGALTKGERRTGDQGMFGLQDNLESDEAHAALQQFYRDVHRGQIEGVSDQSIQETMGLQLIDPSTGGLRADLPPMSQFLNRILSLPVGEQNRVFNAFSDRFRDVIDHAVESGTLDAGTETYRADKIVKNTETTVYTDPTSGAVTKHVALHAFSKNYPTPFEELHDGKSGRASYQAPSFYVRSRRDGQIFAVVPTTYSRTGADGITTEFYRMVTPTNWRYIEKDRMDRALSGTTRNAPTADRVTDLAEARKGWDERVAATPEFKRSDLHLITGAVLPIWDRLQGNPKIFRLQTDQGERLLGRVIANNDIGTTLTNLGAEAARVDFRPNEVAAKVLDGATATLANGWTLKRSMVAGEWRIELKGPSFADYGPLRQDGVFQERIGYDTRLFVPTGDRAAEVLGRITERRPVTAVDSGGQPAQTMFSLRQRRKTPQSNTSLDAEAMSAAVKLATYHVEAGARSFTEFSRAMVADIGDAIRPHLQQLYSEAHDTIQQEIDRYLNEPVDRTQAQRPAGNVPTLLDQGPPKPRPSVGHNGGPPVDLGLHGAPERGETVRPPQEDPGGLFSPPPGPPRAPVPPEVEAARITAPAKIKNLNFAENYAIFPRTLASLDAMSARLWNAWKARDYEAANNVTTLRHEIAGDFLKLNKSDRLGVAAALEIGRIAPEGLYRDDNGRIVVRNDTVPFARWSKVGDVLRLSDAQTRAADEAISLGGKQWDMLMQGAAHRFGWEGTLDPKAIREAAARVDEKAGAKRLGRLADLLDAMQAQRKNIYFPMQRFGSHYISVRPKEGPDVAAGLGGKPPLAWFETIEKPGLQDFLGTTYGRFSVEAKAAQRIAELRRQFPADRFDITQGNFVRDPEILRKLDLPALQKLMMMMENKVEAGVRKQVMAEEGGPKTPTGVREEASARYESMYGKTIEAFYDALFEELKAGYRKHASVVPGYSGDFDRAISSHMHQIANNAANMVHRDGIESAYQDIQDRHPHENVKRYWRDWRAYQEDPKSLLGRAADTLNQVGFTWVMGMNPSSTIIMATHTPLAATPVLSVGVGAGPASAAIGRGLRAAYGALRFDKMVGGHIDLEKAMAGMPPEKQAFLRKMANEGRLEAVGADDLARLNERQSQLFGEHAGLMRRAMDIATSNVRAVDQANRFGVASAAWDIGNDPAKLNAAAAPLMRHNALFSDMVRNSGLSAETYGRFMLSEAAFEWGKQNRMPITRGPLGTLAGSLHGFQTRYLSTALRLSKNMGPEGKIAAAFMMGALALGAGMAGLPFAQDTGNAADAVWRHFGGYNPEIGAKLEDMLGSAIGKVGAQIVLHGAPSVFPGIDLGGRIGFGDVVSRMMDPANVMGTMPAIMWKSWENAKARWDNGQGLSAAAAEAVPFALRGPLRALNESERGIVSRSGLQLMPPSALSTGDLIRTGFGFTPESVAEMYRERQRYYEAQQAQPSLVAKIKSGDPSWMQDAQRMGWSIGRIRSFQRSVVRGPTDMQFQRYEQNAHPNQW